MKHLVSDEILQFISFTTVNETTLRLASEVNGHILRCAACRQRVADAQEEYDLLTSHGLQKNRDVVLQYLADKLQRQDLQSDLNDPQPESDTVNIQML